MGEPTEEEVDRVEQSMISAREDAITKGHVCNFRTLARAAISEMRAMDREKATAKAAWFNHNLVGHWGPGKPKDDSPSDT